MLCFIFGFTFNVKSQNTVDKPILSNGQKTIPVNKNVVDTNMVEHPKLSTGEKTTKHLVKNKTSETPKKEIEGTPQLGIMNKKEEK